MLAEERLNDSEEALQQALDGRQADIWTAIPSILQSYDPIRGVAQVQPALQYNMRQMDGTLKLVTLPLLVDVPVQFPGSAGLVLSWLPVSGDECLVVFAQRCIDSWWQNGGVQPPAEFRMHDPSDGFALMGFRSLPNVLNPPTPANAIELRSADRTTRIAMFLNGTIQLVNPNGSFALSSEGNCTISGNLVVQGSFSFGGGAAAIELTTGPATEGRGS